MGIITEISCQKNKKRVNIFVDGEFVSGLSFETAVKHGLKTGKEIDQQELEQLIQESEALSAFSAGLSLLSISSKTSKELKEKLVSKGFSENIAEQAITKLTEYKYIDDLAFAKSYVKSFSNKSKRELESKLKNKGIAFEFISEALETIDDIDEKANAVDCARKYMRSKIWNEKTKNNLFASLARKGFGLETIYYAMDVIKKEMD